jgi:hypothetical protein
MKFVTKFENFKALKKGAGDEKNMGKKSCDSAPLRSKYTAL